MKAAIDCVEGCRSRQEVGEFADRYHAIRINNDGYLSHSLV